LERADDEEQRQRHRDGLRENQPGSTHCGWKAMARRGDIETYLNTLLAADRFRDYGPNGLQVEGKPEVRKLVSGVTASLAFIDAAIAAGADALLVHHGLFWRGQDGRLTGWLKTRVERLMSAGVNLFAYHLPLDAHESLGNNAQFGRQLGLTADARFGEQDLGFIGSAPSLTSDALAETIDAALQRRPVVIA